MIHFTTKHLCTDWWWEFNKCGLRSLDSTLLPLYNYTNGNCLGAFRAANRSVTFRQKNHKMSSRHNKDLYSLQFIAWPYPQKELGWRTWQVWQQHCQSLRFHFMRSQCPCKLSPGLVEGGAMFLFCDRCNIAALWPTAASVPLWISFKEIAVFFSCMSMYVHVNDV